MRLAEHALAVNPYSAAALGILGDARIETGDYEAAFAAFDRMAALKPTAASYARVSYARELLGRTAAAIDAMKLAVSAAAATGEPAAWTLVELGNLYYNSGRLRPAERAYREALARFPGYHRAEAGAGRVAAQEGGSTRPSPSTGARSRPCRCPSTRPASARRWPRPAATPRRPRPTSSSTSMQQPPRGERRPHRARDGARRPRPERRRRGRPLARAEAYGERRSIEAEDVLAWALYRNGRCEEALGHSHRALRLGTRDALKLFHRGMIERCLGRPAGAARTFRAALDINPYFSPRWAPVAKEAAR